MKVTMISREYPPHIYGGAGVHLQYLTQELSKIMEVEVRCWGDQNESFPGCRVKGYSHWERMNEPRSEKFTAALQTLSTDLAIVRDPIDSIVHTHTWYASFAGFMAKLLYKVPFVLTCHSLEPLRPWKEEQLGTGYNLSLWVEKLGIENADLVIAVSEEMKQDILKYFDTTPDRIEVIHNGIDLTKWGPRPGNALRKEFNIEGDYILFVGRTTRQKGIVTLIDAINYIERKDIKVVLRSGAADTEEIKQEIEEKVRGKNNIIWIKRTLTEEELMTLYTESKFFICPSVYEPFGIINLEAMACEKAVIASAVGGIKEVVVPEETGILVPPGDPVALAAAINRLLADEALAKRFGKAGRARVEKYFSWKRIAEKTKEAYAKLTGERLKDMKRVLYKQI